MKTRIAGWKICALVISAFLTVIVSLGAAYAEPLLVMQPAYTGMKFYIHQPNGIPANWYATYDGYPVWKGTDGVWFYGSYSNQNLTQTYYVVGSVIPSVVGISPYDAGVTYSAPVATTTVATTVVPVENIIKVENIVKWVLDPSFMALGNWSGNVDRVGILAKPAIPVAWKGMWPKVLYAWTGSQWYQITAREGDRPGDVLRNNLYVLTRLVHQNGSRYWQAPDIAFLMNQSANWGYAWMGEIGPNPQRVY